MDFLHRRSRLIVSLREQRLQAFLVTHLPNVRYLCGFTGSNAVLAVMIPSAGRPRLALFTDGRYTLQARSEVKCIPLSGIIITKRSALTTAAEWLAVNTFGARYCGIESDHITHAAFAALEQTLPARIKPVPSSQVVEDLRMVKDATEITQIRKAVHLASNVFAAVVTEIHPGMKENALAAQIEYLCRRMGADGMSFDTLVAGGKRSAMPHGVASGHPLPKNGFLVLDFGVKLDGYCSDMTRTLHLGRPNARSRRIYDAVRASQEAGIKTVKPGVAASEVDYACRKSLQNAGLARYFTHSTGHGVGLEIHESPGIRASIPNKKKTLKPARKGRISGFVSSPANGKVGEMASEKLMQGMVVTIEPGVYIPGFGGVRIEDMVVVTETGCEVLTPTTKDLLVL